MNKPLFTGKFAPRLTVFCMALSSIVCVNANAASVNAYSNGKLNYESVWQCDRLKPNWYCDEQPEAEPEAAPPIAKKPEVPKAKAPEPQDDKPKRIEIPDLKTTEQMKVELKRREDVAVMTPTAENIKDYLELWQVVQNKASSFADSWQRVVWTNPKFDYSLQHPTNNSALRVAQQEREQTRSQALLDIAKHHGLIFFFRSDCSYCHKMSSVLKMLTAQYGMEVLAVSIDGAGLPAYPNFVDGRAVAAQWGVETVPALFIGSKDTKEHAPIGFGLMSLTEVAERIFVLTNTKVGENF